MTWAARGVAHPSTQARRRRDALARPGIQLPVIVVLLVAAVASWFAPSAAIGSVQRSLALDVAVVAALPVVVQLSFALGAATTGVLRIADRVPPARILPSACAAIAVADVLPIVVETAEMLLASRIAVGLLLGVAYPVGMRAGVSWFAERGRGTAVAAIVGALTLGTAAPHLIALVGGTDWRATCIVVAGLALLAACLSLGVAAGPQSAPPGRTTTRDVLALLRDPAQRRVSLAYVAHMWETYAFWVWVPALLVSVVGASSGRFVALVAFGVIGVAGAVGCAAGGWISRHRSQRAVALWASVASGCCGVSMLAAPWLPIGVLVAILALWGAAVIADSAMYSAMTGTIAGRRPVGTAIAVQMAVGYALSAAGIALTAALAAASSWSIALAATALAPLLSVVMLAGRARRRCARADRGRAPRRAARAAV